ncbi:MAG: hypothetical protein ABS939_00660 [Psychrobacillus sp.]
MNIIAEFVQNNSNWIYAILVIISLLSGVFNIFTLKQKNKSDYEIRTNLIFAVTFTGISVALWFLMGSLLEISS